MMVYLLETVELLLGTSMLLAFVLLQVDLMLFLLIVFRMEIDKTRWSRPWNSDQNCTQNSARGWWGSRGRGGRLGVVEAKGVVEVKGVGGGRVGWWGSRAFSQVKWVGGGRVG